MAQSQTESEYENGADEYEYDADYTLDDEQDAIDFTDAALGNIRKQLESNLGTARGMGKADDTDTVDDVLDPENVRQIQVRARPLENPRVTVWLSDCPIWANDAWTDYIYPRGLNAYNGKTHTVFDVRPQ